MARPPASLLKDTHPEIAAQLIDQTQLGNLGTGSAKKLQWRCPDHPDHIWTATVYNRTNTKSGGTGCPYCDGKKILAGFNDVATTHPDVAALFVDQSMTTQVAAQSNKKFEFRCNQGHTWTAPVSRLSNQGSRCPYCSGRKSIAGQTDITTTHPDIAAQLVDPSLATQLKAGSNKKVTWQCQANSKHTWTTSPYLRIYKNERCPECYNRRTIAGRNDLATTHPGIAAQLVDQSLATTINYNSSTPIEWRCDIHTGFTWKASPFNRAVVHSGCPVCANRVVLTGVNDLATTHPTIAAQLQNQQLATQVTFGSGKVVTWQCPTDSTHTWASEIFRRTNDNNPLRCPHCFPQSSDGEIELAKIVATLVHPAEVHTSVRHVLPNRYEIDIYLPEHKVGIEFNGVYWHSEAARRGKDYHAQKSALAHNAGIQLIHVWEDDWRDKKDIVIRMIAHKLHASDRLHLVLPDYDNAPETDRIFARKLITTTLTGKEAANFYEHNHIQGATSATYHYALQQQQPDGTRLTRAVMSVSRPRNNVRRGGYVPGRWDIKRYATRGTVVGGFSKLLKHAERDMLAQGEKINEWVSFSAHDVSDGSLYNNNGFIIDRHVQPDYYYVGDYTNWTRVAKSAFKKSNFRDARDLLWQPEWTEPECAKANGLHRIYDAGKTRWKKVLS